MNNSIHPTHYPDDLGAYQFQLPANFSFIEGFQARQTVLRSRSTMLILSYLLEELAAAYPHTTLIATFQRMAFFRPQISRYTTLTPKITSTFVIGLPDTQLPVLPGVSYIPVQEAWPLYYEWAVIVSGPACAAALVARDREEPPARRRSRSFEGLWTTEAAQIDRVVAQFYHALGQSIPQFIRDQQATYRNTVALQQAIAARLSHARRV